ncbi:MAG: glycosyltransferase [Bacteroidia bacterium]
MNIDETYDVIIMGLTRWDNTLYSSILGIAKEFAKNHRVFYIDRPVSFKDYLKEKKLNPISNRKEAILYGKNIFNTVNLDGTELITVTPKMSMPINFLPHGFLYEKALKYNQSLISTVIDKTIQEYKIEKYIFINSFIPGYFDVFWPSTKAPLLKIYRSTDDISQEHYIAKHGVKEEQSAVKNADIVVTTSFKLSQKLSNKDKPAFRIPNAVDPELFHPDLSALKRPKEIEHVPGKIILFTGMLSRLRIDYELLKKIAQSKEDYTLVVVGLYDQKDIIGYGLQQEKNIIFTGAKPASELKNFLAHADCAIIPFLKNQLTESIYPLKINEYMLFGLPVVSSNFSEDIRTFNGLINICDNHEEFIQNIDIAIQENSEEKRLQRIETAQSNTWKVRVNEIKKLIKEKIKEKSLV